jgi:cysteine desulfurase
MPLYLDNNATTALDAEVLEAMLPYMTSLAGNPSSRHAMGRHARRAVDLAVRQIADALHCDPTEVLFVSGATEANNLAILGAPLKPGDQVLVHAAEHPSALAPARKLAERGVEVVELPVDESGILREFSSRISERTKLIVVQSANSETGVVQAIDDWSRGLAPSCRLHVDAVQAVGRIPLDFQQLHATTLALSGHKIHGPPGVGALIVRKGYMLRPLLHGGEQQQAMRPGTEPVALIVGLGKAVELAAARQAENYRRLAALRDRLEGEILRRIPDVVRNGSAESRLPNTTNLSFVGANAERLLIALDLAGLCCSAGTACASGSLEPSPVLLTMGLPEPRVDSAVRLSLSRCSSDADIDQAVAILERTVAFVRTQGASSKPLSASTER